MKVMMLSLLCGLAQVKPSEKQMHTENEAIETHFIF